jgi:hypothetical protein
MLKRERLILRVEGLHVPLIDEATGQVEPRSVGKGIARVCLVCRDLVPVAGCERAVMPNDVDYIGAYVGSENFRGNLCMSGITEDLADVVKKGSENDLVVRARALGTGRDL